MTGTALWQSIASTLRSEIASGGYDPGARLPTEADLARRFGVNRHTVRRALAHLAELGEVRSRRGAGVFVAGPRTDYPLGERVRFHQNMLATGRTPSRRFLRMETRAATLDECAALALDNRAQVHVVEGLSLVDGAPVALFQSAFPASTLPSLLQDLQRSGSVTEALRAGGIGDYTRASTRITAEAAEATVAAQLGIEAGAPILRTVAVNVDPSGTPVEYGITSFSGEKVALTVAQTG
jgi:GntR family phosphonate transport system transcriptional regulator